eukprot:446274-Prymnesium_polylepis.1
MPADDGSGGRGQLDAESQLHCGVGHECDVDGALALPGVVELSAVHRLAVAAGQVGERQLWQRIRRLHQRTPCLSDASLSSGRLGDVLQAEERLRYLESRAVRVWHEHLHQ